MHPLLKVLIRDPLKCSLNVRYTLHLIRITVQIPKLSAEETSLILTETMIYSRSFQKIIWSDESYFQLHHADGR